MRHLFIYLLWLKRDSPAVFTGQRKILLGRRQRDKNAQRKQRSDRINSHLYMSLNYIRNIRVSIIKKEAQTHFTSKASVKKNDLNDKTMWKINEKLFNMDLKCVNVTEFVLDTRWTRRRRDGLLGFCGRITLEQTNRTQREAAAVLAALPSFTSLCDWTHNQLSFVFLTDSLSLWATPAELQQTFIETQTNRTYMLNTFRQTKPLCLLHPCS